MNNLLPKKNLSATEQALADALARAEKAERASAAMRAFISGLDLDNPPNIEACACVKEVKNQRDSVLANDSGKGYVSADKRDFPAQFKARARNLPPGGKGKYALLKMRRVPEHRDNPRSAVNEAIRTLEIAGILDRGGTAETDFFVIRLKDKFAAPALAAYAMAAYAEDQEYGMEILNLAKRAAEYPAKRMPD